MSSAAERAEKAFLALMAKDVIGAMQLITGMFVGLHIEYTRRKGFDAERDLHIEGGDDQRKITIHARNSGTTFQSRVRPWLIECFGEMVAGDREERNHRFLEESLELVQSLGCSREEAHQLVDYVFGREIGVPAQEVGGVMVTLAALCLANKLNMHTDGEAELARITQPATVEKIRAKQAAKPQFGPLPGVYPERSVTESQSEEG